MSSCRHGPDIKCRFPRTRSCPRTIFSGVLISLVRKRDTSPESISDSDGHSLLKVQVVHHIAVMNKKLLPARTGAPFNAPVLNGNRVEMCLKLRLVSS